MRYLSAIPVMLMLFLFDLAVLAACFFIVGVVVIEYMDGDYPLSYNFARKVWFT